MGENSHFAVELQGATADRLAITGNLDLSALVNNLDVIDLGLTGMSWVIATYTGTLTGTFENITPGYSIDYGTLSNSQITLNLAPDGLLGDFNEDDVVDAADYITWRRNATANNPLPNDDGLMTQAARYSLWTAHFGETAPGGGSGLHGGAVPEPATCLLAGFALGALMCGSRRRR
jgi:hypothetical protein